jgi:hypothetical protein
MPYGIGFICFWKKESFLYFHVYPDITLKYLLLTWSIKKGETPYHSVRGHSNNTWHFFLPILDPPSPMCHLETLAWIPEASKCRYFYDESYKFMKFFLWTFKELIISNIITAIQIALFFVYELNFRMLSNIIIICFFRKIM